MAPVNKGSPLKVFVTGAAGFVGFRVVKALLAGGHKVSALSRRTGTELDKLDVHVVHATLKDLDVLAATAAESDAVIHLAFNHDFTKFQESVDENFAAINAMAGALEGTGKLLVTTSVAALISDTGDSTAKGTQPVEGPRAAAESATLAVSPLHLPNSFPLYDCNLVQHAIDCHELADLTVVQSTISS